MRLWARYYNWANFWVRLFQFNTYQMSLLVSKNSSKHEFILKYKTCIFSSRISTNRKRTTSNSRVKTKYFVLTKLTDLICVKCVSGCDRWTRWAVERRPSWSWASRRVGIVGRRCAIAPRAARAPCSRTKTCPHWTTCTGRSSRTKKKRTQHSASYSAEHFQ
jgi:hypothetical protein